nr:hypothetical protein [Tanacetum cinerariifolium]
IGVSKKNSDVFGNGTEKYKELTVSEGLYRDDCVLINDERDKSDARCKDVLENIAGMDGITGIEEIAEKVQSGKSNGEQVENCQKRVNVALKTYDYIVKHDELPKKLNYIPTLITESGNEVVIFDEVLLNKGSERWNLTLCGHFVRFDMNIHDLRQHVFKFRDSNGLNAVLDKGLWMVKIINVLLEAWSVEGINAIASSLGKPMMMDTNIAAICHKGICNFDFARILVEMDAEKELKKEIVIQYKDKNNNVRGSKTVKVVYDWIPLIYTHCKVFGHDDIHYKKRGVAFGNNYGTNIIETTNEDKEAQIKGKHLEVGKQIYQGFRSNTNIGNNATKS